MGGRVEGCGHAPVAGGPPLGPRTLEGRAAVGGVAICFPRPLARVSLFL